MIRLLTSYYIYTYWSLRLRTPTVMKNIIYHTIMYSRFILFLIFRKSYQPVYMDQYNNQPLYIYTDHLSRTFFDYVPI